jgi:TetR/AcrR family transcriptional regulator, mexJK operon transcriptional repressor
VDLDLEQSIDASNASRSERKRAAILDAARAVFLQKGYLGTSMDEIAALAAVSKQTVYKHFADKERLFTDLVLSTTDRIAKFLADVAATLEKATDLATGVRALARALAAAIMQPDVLQLRRLIVAEADRFPDLGRAWFERGFERGLASMAAAFQGLADRGLLRLDDPQLAADHLAGLVLWIPVNRVMFCGHTARASAGELDRLADRAVDVFLAAYAAR